MTLEALAMSSRRLYYQGPENADDLSSPHTHTIAYEDAVGGHVTSADGQFGSEQITTTVSPVVVRQHQLDLPGALPIYQEGLGYSFLLPTPKYPGLCRLGDGTLVLTLTVALTGELVEQEAGGSSGGPAATFMDESTRGDVLLLSINGEEWSQPIKIPGYRTTPMALGGDRLMLRGWTSKIDIPETL
jgi:hypothetical protein